MESKLKEFKRSNEKSPNQFEYNVGRQGINVWMESMYLHDAMDFIWSKAESVWYCTKVSKLNVSQC